MWLIWLKEGYREEVVRILHLVKVGLNCDYFFISPGINFNYGSSNETLTTLKKAPTTIQDFCLDNALHTASLLTQQGSSETVPSCPKSDHCALILVLGVNQSRKGVTQRLLVGSWPLFPDSSHNERVFSSSWYLLFKNTYFISNSICMCVCACLCVGL